MVHAILWIGALMCAQELSPKVAQGGQEKPPTGGPFTCRVENPVKVEYSLLVPQEYTGVKSWPLLVLLHPADDSGPNFIEDWIQAAKEPFQYIVVAPTSNSGDWGSSEGRLILTAMEDVKKCYRVDPGRQFLVGYSLGADMACNFGGKQPGLFRTVTAIAGGSYFTAERTGISTFFICGSEDDRIGTCKSAARRFQKEGYDSEYKEIAGMDHAPLAAEVFSWVLDRIRSRDTAPDNVLRRAKRALGEKRTADAIVDFLTVAALDPKGEGEKVGAAKQELAKLEEQARKKLEEAKRDLEKGEKKGAKQILVKLIREYAGLPAAKEAGDFLKKLGE